MCNFVGFCNLNKDFTSNDTQILNNITNELSNQTIDGKNLYVFPRFCLRYEYSPEKDNQETSFIINENTYTIIFNGNIYNLKEIRNRLISLGCEFNRIF